MKKLMDVTSQFFITKGINLNIKPYLKSYLESTGELGTDVFVGEAEIPFWENNLGELVRKQFFFCFFFFFFVFFNFQALFFFFFVFFFRPLNFSDERTHLFGCISIWA